MASLLCCLGLHKWEQINIWEPSIDAPIIKRYFSYSRCQRCGEERNRMETYFNSVTGLPTMKTRILLYCDAAKREVVVLEVDGAAESTLVEHGNDLGMWPEDLDAYGRQGLFVWEGETDGDEDWEGDIRKLTPDEWRSLHNNQTLWT